MKTISSAKAQRGFFDFGLSIAILLFSSGAAYIAVDNEKEQSAYTLQQQEAQKVEVQSAYYSAFDEGDN